MRKFQKNINLQLEHYLLLALVFLVPFFFLPYTFAPVALSKQLLSAVLIFGALVYFLVQFLRSGFMILPPLGLLKPATLFFGAVLVSGLFSQARGVSFWGNSPDSVAWAGLYLAGLLLATIVFKGEKIVKTAAILLLSGSGILGIFTIMQLQGVELLPVNPVGGMFAAGFVATAVLAGIVSFLSVADSIDKKYKIFLVSVAVLLGIVVAQINLWSAWMTLALGLVVSFSVVGAGIFKQNKNNIKPLMLPFFIIIVSLFFIINPSAAFFESQHSAEEVGLTLRTTTDITLNSLSGTRFVHGTGPGTFQYNYLENKPLSINETDFWDVNFSYGYSTIATNVSTWGVLGIAAFLYLIFVVFKISIKGLLRAEGLPAKNATTTQKGIAVAGLSSFSVLAASIFIYRADAVMILIMFLAAGITIGALRTLGIVKAKKINASANPQSLVVVSLAVLVLISAAFVGMYMLTQRYVAQAYAERAARSENITDMLDGLDRAAHINPRDDMIRRLKSQALLLKLEEVLGSEDFAQKDVTNRFSRIMQDAIAEAEAATQINPRGPENWTQLGEIYENIIGLAQGAESKAISSYREAFDMDPRNPLLPLAQARVYLASVDAASAQAEVGIQAEEGSKEDIIMSAIDKINESINLKGDLAPARLLLSSAYQRLGQLDKAIKETSQLFTENPLDPNLAFQLGVLYWEDDELANAQDSLEAAIDLADGSFGNARYLLGLVYDARGDTDAAIEQFERLLKDNPGNDLVITALNNLQEGLPALHGTDDNPLEEPAVDDFSEVGI